MDFESPGWRPMDDVGVDSIGNDAATSIEDTFADICPSEDVLLQEALRFLAFRRIFAWKTSRMNNICPDREELKSVAKHAHCK